MQRGGREEKGKGDRAVVPRDSNYFLVRSDDLMMTWIPDSRSGLGCLLIFSLEHTGLRVHRGQNINLAGS